MKYSVTIDDKTLEVDINNNSVLIDKKPSAVVIEKVDDHYVLNTDKNFYHCKVIKSENGEVKLNINGKSIDLQIKDENALMLESLGINVSESNVEKSLKAPMPGNILKVNVQSGDTVDKGSPLLILEAMKMENVIKSSINGVIKNVCVAEGENVEKNTLLLEFE